MFSGFEGKKINREGLEEKDASEQLGNLLLAGVDTTHHALMWLIVNLAENPDVQGLFLFSIC